jgi:hypothetical protein
MKRNGHKKHKKAQKGKEGRRETFRLGYCG